MPIRPTPPIPLLRLPVLEHGARCSVCGLPVLLQEVVEGGCEDGGYFFGVETGDHFFFYRVAGSVCVFGGGLGGGRRCRGWAEEGNTGSNAQLRLRQIRRQLAQMLDLEPGG